VKNVTKVLTHVATKSTTCSHGRDRRSGEVVSLTARHSCDERPSLSSLPLTAQRLPIKVRALAGRGSNPGNHCSPPPCAVLRTTRSHT
jgi:hypothetical protein